MADVMGYERTPRQSGAVPAKNYMTIAFLIVSAAVLAVAAICYVGFRRPAGAVISERWVDSARNVKVLWVGKSDKGAMYAVVYPFLGRDGAETKDAYNQKLEITHSGGIVVFPSGMNVAVALPGGGFQYYNIPMSGGHMDIGETATQGRPAEVVAEKILRSLAEAGALPDWIRSREINVTRTVKQ